MHRILRSLGAVAAAPVLLVAAALTLAAASPAWAVWPNDPTINVPVCTVAGDQWNPAVAPDGKGGTIVAWFEWRGANADIYAQRLDAAGRPQWTAGGVAVCTAAGDQTGVKVVADGSGGAVLVWQDARSLTNLDIYARRVSAAGTPLWAANGVAICTATGDQANPVLVSDGRAGAYVAWQDHRSGSTYDIYAQHLVGNGRLDWATNGVVVSAAAGDQTWPSVASDTSTDVVIAWQDLRSGTSQDVYVQRVDDTGNSTWTANGIVACTATGDQLGPLVCGDGATGAIVTWCDKRSGAKDVYAQRFNLSGVAQWTANGIAVCALTGDQWSPQIVADGAGGAFLSWFDWRGGNADVYAQRLSGAGAAQWTANGVLVATASGDQTNTTLAPDSTGGVIVAWQDPRANAGNDVYAQRLSSTGVAQWTANGVCVSRALGEQTLPVIAADGDGGAVVAWLDARGGDHDIYAQHVDPWGWLGGLPSIVAVKDVPNDQGGHLTVRWDASPLDAYPAYAVQEYWVYQRDPAQSAWVKVGTMYASGLAGYSTVVNTLADSTAGANARTSFYVEARGVTTGRFWDSPVDSGYSVDNLSPAAPTQLAGTFTADGTVLRWSASAAPDVAGYRLHRGTGADFAPTSENLVAAPTGTQYTDAGAAPAWYKLAAVDAHGNLSPYVTLSPDGTVGVAAPAPPCELALSAPAPNPLRASTTLRLALPRAAGVSLAVYDQQGRRVRTLVTGALPAGEHPFTWDGRDDGGRALASGLYFVRLETGGRALARRVALVR